MVNLTNLCDRKLPYIIINQFSCSVMSDSLRARQNPGFHEGIQSTRNCSSTGKCEIWLSSVGETTSLWLGTTVARKLNVQTKVSVSRAPDGSASPCSPLLLFITLLSWLDLQQAVIVFSSFVTTYIIFQLLCRRAFTTDGAGCSEPRFKRPQSPQ